MRYLVTLQSRAALRRSLVGGKAAPLARLHREGFNVPPACVITTHAFDRVLLSLDPQLLRAAGERNESALQGLHQAILGKALPAALVRRISTQHRALGGRVAVRSSFVGEDSDDASFAGQLESFLDLTTAEETIAAVKKCFASLFGSRIASYAAARGESPLAAPGPVKMAVIIQKMAEARAAGVAFSADPVTGRRCVIIEAAEGAGLPVVGGTVTPDRYLVDARGELAEVIPAHAGRAVLPDRHIVELAGYVHEISLKMHALQDIEWVWDGEVFHFIQARPITSLAGKHIFSHKLVADMSPGLVKPLLWSTNAVSMSNNVLGRIFTLLIGPNDIDFLRSIRLIHSRIYADMTFFGELLQRIGLPENFFETITRDEKAHRRYPKLTFKFVRKLAFTFLPFLCRYSQAAGELRRFIHVHGRALDSYRHVDWRGRLLHDQLYHFEQLLRLHSKCQWHIFISALNMSVRNRIVAQYVKKHAPQVQASDLIRGLVGLKGLEPNESIQKIARRIRELGAGTGALLMEGDDDAIRQALAASAAGREVIAQFDVFMRQYGFLSASSTDFAGTPWIENPHIIWLAIGTAAAQPRQIVKNGVEAIREEAGSQVRARLRPVQKLLFDRLLRSTMTYIHLREKISLLFSEDTYQMRRIITAMAEQLVIEGQLAHRDDIFYLFYRELKEAAVGTADMQALRAAVKMRRSEVEADAHIKLDDTICGDHIVPKPIIKNGDQAFLTGISGSSGICRGYAYVVEDPSRVTGGLGETDILVVPFTDVGWTPLFSRIGGIVAETGGQLSHTSIIAREYGLPAVVSVKDAMQLIKNKQPITVDGNSGRVYLTHIS